MRVFLSQETSFSPDQQKLIFPRLAKCTEWHKQLMQSALFYAIKQFFSSLANPGSLQHTSPLCISQHKNNHFLLKHDWESHQHICRESRSMCAKWEKKRRLQGRDATHFGDLLIFPHIISLSALLHIRCEEKRSPNVSEGDCNVDIFVFFLQTC